ncbi:MAG: tetratricopeptide repeat protein [Deltaproteobacteria bacterium]|jgi:tetratricopeptide (TPR) repeat protein|nr:tetratricopeptide repeat protein [Deltaproteobacteria bacterium]
MSYIHDALKKAQKDKDGVSASYDGVVAATNTGRSIPLWKWALGFVVFLSLLAVILSKTTLQGDKNHTHILYDEGLRYQRTGRAGDARKKYLAVLKTAPDNVSAMNNLAVIYLSEGNYPKARKLFEKATELKPDCVDAHYNLACLHVRTNNLSESLKRLKMAIKLDVRVKEWARMDKDLVGLRGQVEYDKLMDVMEMGEREIRSSKSQDDE